MKDLDAYIDAAAGLIGLAIAPEYRAGVARHLGIAAEMAAILDAVDLNADELALAPVYLPPDRPL